jgi:hypothetical protein
MERVLERCLVLIAVGPGLGDVNGEGTNDVLDKKRKNTCREKLLLVA